MKKHTFIGIFTLVFLIGFGVISTQVEPVFPETTGDNHYIYLPVVQKPLNTWIRTYGSNDDEFGSTVFENLDGGYFLVAESEAKPTIMKLAHDGTILWQKKLDISDMGGIDGKLTSDGGVILAFMGFYSGNNGNNANLMKLDRDGNIEWQRNFGAENLDAPYEVLETSDGGYIFVGSISLDGISTDLWVVKVDSNGNLLWQYIYNHGSFYHRGYSIVQTNDGGFIIAGSEGNNDDGSTLNYNLWVLKIDKDGVLDWQKVYDDGLPEGGFSIVQAVGGDYVVTGYTESSGAGGEDVWVLRLNSIGNTVWQKTYGGVGDDRGYSIVESNDNGFVIVGTTDSFGNGKRDAWIIKLNGSGNIIWQKTYGGENDDDAFSVSKNGDKFVVAGAYRSHNADDSDAWAFKIDANGIADDCSLAGESTATVMNTMVAPQSESVWRQVPTSSDTAVPTNSFVSGLWSESQVCPAP